MHHWFMQFNNSNFELNDLPPNRTPLQININDLKQLIDEDPRLTTQRLAE